MNDPMPRMRWRIVRETPDPRCTATRGPRSIVVCERTPDGHSEHIGRGRYGQVFAWSDSQITNATTSAA